MICAFLHCVCFHHLAVSDAAALHACRGDAQQAVHFTGDDHAFCAVKVVDDVIRLFDFAACFAAKAAHRCSKAEYPHRRANGHMVIVRKVNVDFFDGHIPPMHTKTSAPPESTSTISFFGRFYFVNFGARAVCFLKGGLAGVAHAGEIHHKAAVICGDVGIVLDMYGKMLLLIENERRAAGSRLQKAENEKCGGHKVQRKDNELDHDPRHQRHAENRSADDAGFFLCKHQRRRNQIRDAVDAQQRDAGEGEILKQNVRKGQYLKIWEHSLHAHDAAVRRRQHTRSSPNSANADEQAPKDQDFSRCVIS